MYIRQSDLKRMTYIMLVFKNKRLTHWGRDKMAAVSQTTLSNGFSWMKKLEFRLRFQWNFFLRIQLTIIQHWFNYWLGAGQATSHYLKQWWLVYWRIYASLRFNELTNDWAHEQLVMILSTLSSFIDEWCVFKPTNRPIYVSLSGT